MTADPRTQRSAGRKAAAPAQCANPLCRLKTYPDNLDALELLQVQPDPARPGATVEARWRLCSLGCLRTYAALCQARCNAQSHPETSEAER